MKSIVPHVPESALSATIVGIDDFALGFVQTYIAEHFATEAPSVEQIEAALQALEAYGGFHGLHSGNPRHAKIIVPDVESIHSELRRRNEKNQIDVADSDTTTLKIAL